MDKTLLMRFDWKAVDKDGNEIPSFKVEIYGNNFTIEQEEWPEVDDLFVTLNGVETDKFGTTWPGANLDSFDLLMKSISVYVNEESEMVFDYVNDAIKDYKDTFMKDNLSLGLAAKSGRHIYDYILNSNLEKLSFEACYSVYGSEFAAYVGDNEIVAIIETFDGSLVTDYEHLYICHIVDSTKDPTYKIEFAHNDSFKEVLKDYDIDLDELFRISAEKEKKENEKSN